MEWSHASASGVRNCSLLLMVLGMKRESNHRAVLDANGAFNLYSWADCRARAFVNNLDIMITIFDIVQILSPLLGLLLGGALGSKLGPVGAIVGALLCGGLGLYLGRLPTLFMIRGMRRKLARFGPAELRAQLRDPRCWTPNILLLELRARGEDISPELPLVLSLMESEHQHRRTFGFAALLSAFPEVAKSLRGYSPTQPVEKCKRKIMEFKQRADASPKGGPDTPPASSGVQGGPPSVS